VTYGLALCMSHGHMSGEAFGLRHGQYISHLLCQCLLLALRNHIDYFDMRHGQYISDYWHFVIGTLYWSLHMI